MFKVGLETRVHNKLTY